MSNCHNVVVDRGQIEYFECFVFFWFSWLVWYFFFFFHFSGTDSLTIVYNLSSLFDSFVYVCVCFGSHFIFDRFL